ncbi:MAG: hypothetical protein ACLTSZ_08915 [Lachnospiraceae bacterium]
MKIICTIRRRSICCRSRQSREIISMFKQYTDHGKSRRHGYIRNIMDFNYPEQGGAD